MATWSDAVSQIASSLDVLNRFVDAIKNAYETGTAIVDKQTARHQRDRLKELKIEMSVVNAEKSLLNEDIIDLKERGNWTTVQDSLRKVAADIGKLCETVKKTDIGGGMELQTELIAALERQMREYAMLATFSAPSSDQEKVEVRKIANRLNALLNKVTELEHILDGQTGSKTT